MSNFLSGYLASVTVAETGYAFDKFDFDVDVNVGEVTNFTGGGFAQFIDGVGKATIRASGPFDQGAMDVFEGGTTFSVVLGFVEDVAVTVPVICKRFTLTADVKDAQRISVELWSNGEFALAPA